MKFLLRFTHRRQACPACQRRRDSARSRHDVAVKTPPTVPLIALTVLAFATYPALMMSGCRKQPPPLLAVTYGAKGIDTIAYDGVPLESVEQYPSDKFYIGHMKITDLNGIRKSGAEYGWGENSVNKTWNAQRRSWDYVFPWGSIQVQYHQDGDALNVDITENNLADSGVILYGASVVPFMLHVGQTPANASAYPAMSDNYTSPGVVAASYRGGTILLVLPDAAKPLYAGYLK